VNYNRYPLEEAVSWPLFVLVLAITKAQQQVSISRSSPLQFDCISLRPTMGSLLLVVMSIFVGSMVSMPCRQRNRMGRDGSVSFYGDWQEMRLKRKDPLLFLGPMEKDLMQITIVVVTATTVRNDATKTIVIITITAASTKNGMAIGTKTELVTGNEKGRSCECE
jgi:hypothetical protein